MIFVILRLKKKKVEVEAEVEVEVTVVDLKHLVNLEVNLNRIVIATHQKLGIMFDIESKVKLDVGK